MADIEPAQADSRVTYWLQQIETAEKWHTPWQERGRAVVERYLDKQEGETTDSAKSRMNVLWSNVETIKPALYAKTPNAKAQRRFRDKDPVGRWGAVVLERANNYTLDAYDVNNDFRQVISDYLLPGRGQLWVSYEPQIAGEGTPNETIEWECCKNRYIHWRDFLTNPARVWDEVFWVAKREYLTKEEAKKQGLNVDDLSFTEMKDGEKPEGEKGGAKKAPVWEIWDKTSGKVYFVSKFSPKLLREPAPPGLKFDGFFPCPRPLTTTTSTDSILPVPDFCQYQNQAAEIDRLTQKIGELTKVLKLAGVFDASFEKLPDILSGTGNTMVPVDNWPLLSQAGGLEGVVDFLPLKEVVVALQQAYISRDQAKAVMYEITGISDIVRGASDANETATAQQIKSQWGSLRIRDRQKEVQRFVRDVMRLNSEIIAEHFQLETLRAMSNAPLLTEKEKQQLQIRQQAQMMAQQNPEQAQQVVAAKPQLQALLQPLSPDDLQKLREPSWEQVVALLRDEKLRGFRIDIETDSTIQMDEAEEKAARTEYLTAMTGFIQAWGPMIMQAPQFAPLAGEMMLFGSRAFKTADALESAIEEAVDVFGQQAALGQQPQDDPQHELAVKDHEFKQKQHTDQMQLEQQRAGVEQQRYEADRQDRLASEQRAQASEERAHGLERERFQFDQNSKASEQMGKTQEREFAVQDGETEHHRALELKGVDREFVKEDRQLEKKDAQGIAEDALKPIADMLKDAADDTRKVLEDAIKQLIKIASAPKSVDIERDKSGKIIGGTATPKISRTVN